MLKIWPMDCLLTAATAMSATVFASWSHSLRPRSCRQCPLPSTVNCAVHDSSCSRRYSRSIRNAARPGAKLMCTSGRSRHCLLAVCTAAGQFAKGVQGILHEAALLRSRVASLEEANQALSKCRRAEKIRLQERGSLTQQDAQGLLDQKEA